MLDPCEIEVQKFIEVGSRCRQSLATPIRDLHGPKTLGIAMREKERQCRGRHRILVVMLSETGGAMDVDPSILDGPKAVGCMPWFGAMAQSVRRR
jgi:hypothetical protein